MDKYAERSFNTQEPDSIDKEILEGVPYLYPDRPTDVEIIFPEFTSVCPWTGLPDFGIITISYVPKELCLEFKALKYYLTSYRNVGILQEHVVNRILDDLTAIINPVSMLVIGEFNPRGGMKTVVRAAYPHQAINSKVLRKFGKIFKGNPAEGGSYQ